MKRIEYSDPTELSAIQGVTVKIAPIPKSAEKGATDLAREMWAYAKRKITAKNGNVILKSADTMTSAFAAKIEEYLSDAEHLRTHFGGKRPTDEEMAKRAGFSRAKWNRLTGGTHLDIERGNAFAVAIALELNESQIAELFYAGGFVLNYEHELDCAIMYFVKKRIYDIKVITETLSQFCDVKNGLDKFTFVPKKV